MGFSTYNRKIGRPNEYTFSRGVEFDKSWNRLNDGEWHVVELDAYPHRTKGHCIIKIDGQIWVAILNGPTKSYHSGRHGDYSARIGVYRDVVDYDHTVMFDD